MSKTIIGIAVVSLLSGCAAIPDFQENRQAIIKNNQEQSNFSLSQVNSINRDNWWVDFKDEQLNELLIKVKSNNVDLKVAKLNLEKSQTYYQVIESNNYPIVNFASSFNREKLSATGMTPPPYAGAVLNMGQIGLSSTYTLDYMNKNGLLLQEQKNKSEGLKNQIDNVELAINIQVIKAYIYYQYLIKEEILIQERIDLQNQILNAYKAGVVIGKYTENQLNDIKNQNILLNNSLNTLTQNKQTTLNMLIQLAGNENINIKESNTIWEIKNTNPTAKVDIKLIRQRPDIKYYFANIEAQRNHFEALKADFYPSISLTGDLGLQKVGFSDLLNQKSLFWNFGPEITLPIFDAGRIKSNYKVAGLDLNIFIENYNNAVYSAIQDVNNSLSKENMSYTNMENQTLVFNNQDKNNQNNWDLYRNGKISQVTANQSKLELLNAKEQVLNNELNYINAKLEVIQSLGGK